MSQSYDPSIVEPTWQQRWEDDDAFRVEEDSSKPKKYILDMFPYPSGKGLHVGHVENYTISDIMSRYYRLKGFRVLHPMGWDAFGLPAEQYAIKNEVHPRVAVERNVATFRKQLKRMGYSYDWSREINTTDPNYYRWTQWIFLKLYERGLAYQQEIPVNWCEALGTVLANEEVIDGKSEVGGYPVVRRPMRQWVLKITAYADRLLDDLDSLDWPDSLKRMQREWIGRSEGAEVTFRVEGHNDKSFTVFTTRPDTLFGATFCVLAPEHALVDDIVSDAQRDDVEQYVQRASTRSERDRIADVKEKTGVATGAFAINPVNGQRVPIWIADYVLATYGTGAVMAVPGHDQRDYEFAKAFDLPIVEVISGGDLSKEAHAGDGALVNSGDWDGKSVADAKAGITTWLGEQGLGRARVQYRLRDWLFSRQRYWGEPFPVIHRKDGTTVPLPDDALPVQLPDVDSYKPTGDGQSPLAAISAWVETTDPRDSTPAMRETDTMPQWAGSCWYYLRFLDPTNSERFVDASIEKEWMPVDIYVGGVEHAVLHLLYARFWHKVLFDLGLVSTQEPFQRLVNQGMIVCTSHRDPDTGKYVPATQLETRDGMVVVKATGKPTIAMVEKMSKSKHNVVNPDNIVREHGADALRLYIMFVGPPEADVIWTDAGITGIDRFLQRAWRLLAGTERHDALPRTDGSAEGDLRRAMHTAIAEITRDMDAIAYNTAVSKLMVLLNAMGASTCIPNEVARTFLTMLSPMAPHIADELWTRMGYEGLASTSEWPTHDPAALAADTIEYAVQINGKVRGKIELAAELPEQEVIAAAQAIDNVVSHLDGKIIRKAMVVSGNLVVLVAT